MRKSVRPMTMMLGLMLILARPVAANHVLLTYIEKPPLYYTNTEGQPAGTLLEQVRKAWPEETLQLEARSPQRALEEIRANKGPVCSIGWFKTPERQAFAVYSVPIARESASLVVVRTVQRNSLVSKASLADLLADKQVRIGVVAGFSYGTELDQLLQPLQPRIDAAPDTATNLRKLAGWRVDAVLADAKDFEYYLQEAKIRPEDVMALSFPDMPQGELRYLMCSKKTSPAQLQKINTAMRPLLERGTAAKK